MCGICGIFDKNISQEDRQIIIVKMLFKQRHRGPDGSYSWHGSDGICFGHNRLKIIDLSEQANQPMVKDNLVISFNGEIYNYIEIKEILFKKGHVFTTSSDTEVILAAYKEWGALCVNQFVGMWAFAIWDTEKHSLFCSRDRFGIKPFYYIHDADRFYFASECKTLKETPLFVNKLNKDQFKRSIIMGWMSYNDETFYDCIKILPAATNLTICDGKFIFEKYWDLNREKIIPSTKEEKNFMFYEMFKESINIHLRSDVNVGGCLSGGLDSSAIASMICKHHPDVNFKTFSIYYEGDNNVDERFFIKEVVKKYKNITPVYYTPPDDVIEEAFDNAIYYADVPIGDSSYLSQYFLMKLAAGNDVIVLIDGQGADEYLAGYMYSFYRLIADYIKKFKISNAINLINKQSKRQDFGFEKEMLLILKTMYTLFNSEQAIYTAEYKSVKKKLFSNSEGNELLFNLQNKFNDKLHSFLYNLIFKTSLPSLLHYVDRNSMTFSIESRVPFLDHRLVEYIFALPFEDKINNEAETKAIMRHSLNDILPEAVSQRKDKKGFVTPGDTQWLRGPLKKILDIDFDRSSCFDKNKVEKLLSDFKKGDNTNSKLVWKAAVANYWLMKNDLYY